MIFSLVIIVVLMVVIVFLLVEMFNQAQELADAEDILLQQDSHIIRITKENEDLHKQLEGGGGSKS